MQNTLEIESKKLSKIIDKKYLEFKNKIAELKINEFESLDSLLNYAYELSESYRYEFRYYVNENLKPESNVVINGLAYTHPTNLINFELQILISQKHKQFDNLYHQYAQDLNSQL